MRILIVSNLVGGRKSTTEELATWLADAGHDVAMVTSPTGNQHQELPERRFRVFPTLYFAAPLEDQRFSCDFLQLSNITALTTTIEEFRPEKILLGDIYGLGPLGIVTFLHEAGFQPAIYLEDNIFKGSGNDPHTRDVFTRLFRTRPALSALKAISVSEVVLEEAETSLGCAMGSPLAVPGWVPDDLSPIRLANGDDVTRFVFASELSGHNGMDILIDAVRLMLERGDKNFAVDLFGPGMVPYYVQRIHAFGLSDTVRYQGLIDGAAMRQRLGDYDALAFPARRHEPLGQVAFEAAAQGCIPIFPAQAGAAEWLLANDCIKISRTPEGLAGAMQRILYMSPEERANQRVAISGRIRRLFSVSRWLPKIESALAALPDPQKGVDVQRTLDAFCTITQIWRTEDVQRSIG